MRFFFPIVLLLVLPVAAWSQNHSSAPLLAVGNGVVIAPVTSTDAVASAAPATTPAAEAAATFPTTAVTAITRGTNGQQIAAPASANTPATSPTPVAPVSPLWPSDAQPVFMQSCVHFHVEFVPACNCIITNLMSQMKHDEFMRLSDAGTIEQDPRYITIRQQCIATPRPRSN